MVVGFFLTDIYSAYNELAYLRVSPGDVATLKFAAKYSDGTYKRVFNPTLEFYSGENYFSVDQNDNLTVSDDAEIGNYQVRASTVLDGKTWGYTFTIGVFRERATKYYLNVDGKVASQIEIAAGETATLFMYATIDGTERLWRENTFRYMRGDFVPTFDDDQISIPSGATGSAIVRASATIKGTEFGYTFTVTVKGTTPPTYDNSVIGWFKLKSGLALPVFRKVVKTVEEYINLSGKSPIMWEDIIGSKVLEYPPYGTTVEDGRLVTDMNNTQRLFDVTCLPNLYSSTVGYPAGLSSKFDNSDVLFGRLPASEYITTLPKTTDEGYDYYIQIIFQYEWPTIYFPLNDGIIESGAIYAEEGWFRTVSGQPMYDTEEDALRATIRDFHAIVDGSRVTSIAMKRGESVVVQGSLTNPVRPELSVYGNILAQATIGAGNVTFEVINGTGTVVYKNRIGTKITVSEGATNSKVFIRIFMRCWDEEYGYTFVINVIDPIIPSSPLNPGGTTSPSNPTNPGTPEIPGGSGGTPSGPSPGEWDDAIGGTIPSDKSPINSTFAGLFRTYAMTLGQVQKLGQELWSPGILDTITKYFENPTDIIMGIYEFPFDIGTGEGEEITFNWIPGWLSTLDVRGTRVEYEYMTVDMGEIEVPRYSGTFYDYQPYTTAELYLPYVGFVPIKYSEIVGEKIGIKYNISKTTGAACAMVSSTKSGRGLIGIYNCSVGRQLPISARDMSSLYANIFKSATSLIGGAIGAMAGAGAVAIGAAGSVGAGMAGGYSLQAAGLVKQGVNMVKHGAKQFGQSAINSVSNANTPVQRSGTLDAITGRLSNQKAFLAVSIPHQNLPAAYGQTIGYPCNVGGFLRQFNGYTEVRSINLSVSGATSEELVEIEEIVKGGIII